MLLTKLATNRMTRLTGRSWLGSGMVMLLVGGISAVAAFSIGKALEGLAC